eukprot:maker-scaffold447_size167621-snap-gene-0.50 protein:Tk02120 transcript:maker-scaffold447_size167621-snap-gene-0.50-mRNA-1 annotation:"bromodomain testis-specific protein"
MGLPAETGCEMSTVNQDNHSPAAPEAQKAEQNGGQEAGAAQAPLANVNGPSGVAQDEPSGEVKESKADISSEDVDVTTPLEENPGEELRRSPPAPVGDLKARLRRVRTHVVSALFRHPKSAAFREPVNAKALGIYPIYYQVIKRPMDLGSVRRKIDRGEYEQLGECLADINQIWTNARTFNLPGHFVHEAAKIMEGVTQDKWDKLEQDERAGLYAHEDQVKPPTPKKRPPKDPSKPPRAPAAERSGPKEARKRVVRKQSQGLPGELHQPQQLKKKYAENLSDQMKQCDSILRQLIADRANSELFLHIEAYAGNTRAPIDLYKIQSSLQNHFYQHPLQFANDVRRIITETYRYHPEESLIVAKAGELHHRFEVLFSKVMFEPVDNPAKFDPLNVTLNEDEVMLRQLVTAQSQVVAIQENVAILIRDLAGLKTKGRRGVPKKRPRGGGAAKPKRARPGPGPTQNHTAAKRRKPNGAFKPQPPQAQASSVLERHNLTVEESLALREQVARLREEQQQKIVDIMLANNETLTTDAHGFTEIDLSNCSALTVSQIQAFINGAQRQEQPRPPPKAPVASPKKAARSPKKAGPSPKKPSEGGHLSDSSSDSDSDDDGSSSNSSSSESN